ncbi:MAG: hypothetical protein KC613_07140 [Myxococcales bacterium]|nr:hypothetical protein [Myxococcales bacterium]
MRRLLLTLLLLGCDGGALTQGVPPVLGLSLDRPFVDGLQAGNGAILEQEVVATVVQAADPDDDTGDPLLWQVADFTAEGGLELREWAYETNFRVRLRIRVYPDTPAGTYGFTLELRNHYGAFPSAGTFFVFR